MKPLLKWSGGKYDELHIIKQFLPKKIEGYYEPFVGGGALWLNIESKKFYINDFSSDLVCFYKLVKRKDKALRNNLDKFVFLWEYCDLFFHNIKDIVFKLNQVEIKKIIYDDENFCIEMKKEVLKRILLSLKKIEKLNSNFNLSNVDTLNILLSGIKGSVYYFARNLYNKEKDISSFFIIKELSYSNMFRKNKKGFYNVAYGGISYNHKNLRKKVSNLWNKSCIELLKKTKIKNYDFEKFISKQKFSKNDFLFIDPPYDSKFSYYEGNIFNLNDHARLFNILSNIKVKWMVVISDSDFIRELYSGFKIIEYDKKYKVNFMNRNTNTIKHLLIKNY